MGETHQFRSPWIASDAVEETLSMYVMHGILICTNVVGWLRELVVRRRTHNLNDFVAGKETKTREGERKSGMSFEENRRTRKQWKSKVQTGK